MDNRWSVYIHISPTQKYYVGITTYNPTERWRKNGTGYRGQPFYNAISKYGWNNIQHKIIASHLDEAIAKELEKYWIARLGSNKTGNGYNITAGGDGTVGVSHFGSDNPFYGKTHSDESRLLMRTNHADVSKDNNPFYGRHHTPEICAKISAYGKTRTGDKNPNYGKRLSHEMIEKIRSEKSVAVCRFDLDMNFIEEFPSTKAAEIATGTNHSLISRVCRGKLKTIHGNIWKYSSEVKEVM